MMKGGRAVEIYRPRYIMRDESKIQYMVHSFESERVVFRGTEQECLDYINENYPEELELYWAYPGEPHYREEENDDDV